MRSLVLVIVILAAMAGRAATADALSEFQSGDYEAAIESTRRDRSTNAESAEIAIRAMLEAGRYREAAGLAEEAALRYPGDAAVLFACYRAFLATGNMSGVANALMAAARTQPGGYDPDAETPRQAAARARALLLLGADPRLVLDRILTIATKTSPDAVEPYLALAEIALDKKDNLLASQTLIEAMKRFPDNADVRYGMARALDDPERVSVYLEQTFERNPNHVPAMIFQATELTDAGAFDEANERLNAALAVNPSNPDALAQKALLAELRGDSDDAEQARSKALEPWAENPEVDYRIGAGLGRRYRFAESIDALQSAISMDPDHVPSHFELGSNLLRFGRDAEGWQHIELVHERDPYHVAAFNLMTLRDAMADLTVLRGDSVDLRLSRQDAAVLGERATALSDRALKEFSAKYDVRLPFRLTVDMLPTEKDFEIRTFSLPVGEGFLGVCFGPLITTCTPRGRMGRANWEAVLWHEIAHTATLTASKHRIPRWLSEGISVHEENLANDCWGMGMNSERREMLLNGDIPNLPDLDKLFRQNIDFAYFYSSLAAEFLFDRIGNEGVTRLLKLLAKDRAFEDALAEVAGPPADVEKDFRKFAKAKADAYCPGIDWKRLSDEEFEILRTAPDAFLTWNGTRYFAAMDRARQLADAADWRAVAAVLEPIVETAPDIRESPGPFGLLSVAYRNLGESEKETTALNDWLRCDAGAVDAASRLLDLALASGNSETTATAADAVLAIDPFNAPALRALGRARMASGATRDGTSIYNALFALETVDQTRLRFELAKALHEHGESGARRQALKVLEENPRFEDALLLLRTINKGGGQ